MPSQFDIVSVPRIGHNILDHVLTRRLLSLSSKDKRRAGLDRNHLFGYGFFFLKVYVTGSTITCFLLALPRLGHRYRAGL